MPILAFSYSFVKNSIGATRTWIERAAQCLRFVHTERRQRQRQRHLLNSAVMNRLCGIQWGFSHQQQWQKAIAMESSWNGLVTHLQRQWQWHPIWFHCILPLPSPQTPPPPVWTLTTEKINLPLPLPSLSANEPLTVWGIPARLIWAY